MISPGSCRKISDRGKNGFKILNINVLTSSDSLIYFCTTLSLRSTCFRHVTFAFVPRFYRDHHRSCQQDVLDHTTWVDRLKRLLHNVAALLLLRVRSLHDQCTIWFDAYINWGVSRSFFSSLKTLKMGRPELIQMAMLQHEQILIWISYWKYYSEEEKKKARKKKLGSTVVSCRKTTVSCDGTDVDDESTEEGSSVTSAVALDGIFWCLTHCLGILFTNYRLVYRLKSRVRMNKTR